jgi:hypothetical protein
MISYLTTASRSLYDHSTFFPRFLQDLEQCKTEVIIESPFITISRVNALLPHLKKLRRKNISILINTRNPAEHDFEYGKQASIAIARLQDYGVQVLYTTKHHRKLAIIDRKVVWEGSLNILSYTNSCEIMRRIIPIMIFKDLMLRMMKS